MLIINLIKIVMMVHSFIVGVSEVYMSEMQNDDGTPMVSLQARYVNVWEIVDNYEPLNDCRHACEMPNY